MNSFNVLAGIYDSFNENAGYKNYLRYIKERFEALSNHDRLYQPRAVDLGCGTGLMSLELAKAGYDVVGVDRSADMLTEAYQKAYAEPELALMFIKQDMRLLSMDAKANLFICCYDSLNYLADENELRQVFERVYLHTVSGGVFIFDLNTLDRFEKYYGDRSFVFKRKDAVLIWECRYDKEHQTCGFEIELFKKQNNLYSRSQETLKQKYFSHETVLDALKESGFTIDSVTDDVKIGAPAQTPNRLIYCAIKN